MERALARVLTSLAVPTPYLPSNPLSLETSLVTTLIRRDYRAA